MKFERYGQGIAKGLTVTIKHLFRHPITTQYPEQRLTTSRRIRGNELIWDNIRCTGCCTCAKACPQGVIEIKTSTDLVGNKYAVEKYQVDTGYCIMCGLCVEACPYEAVYMGYSYERAKYRRGELVQNKEQMLVSTERPMSGYFNPEMAAKLPKQTLLLDRDEVTE
ncbi:MAG: NADH-quinone oxidoreductase subunit I [Chloroflexi bacterium]|nr:NADH-quinone oxidoreductase subunit I [Chloroflexota bacterium]